VEAPSRPSSASTPINGDGGLERGDARLEAGVGGEGERDAVAEVGEGADDVGADVAVLGEDDPPVHAHGGGARVGGDGDRARAGGERHPAEVDSVAGDFDGAGGAGEAQARERLGGGVGARRGGGEQQGAVADGGALEGGRERHRLVGHERERGRPVGGVPPVVDLRLHDGGERERHRGHRREEGEQQHPAPVPRRPLRGGRVRRGRWRRPGGGEHGATLSRHPDTHPATRATPPAPPAPARPGLPRPPAGPPHPRHPTRARPPAAWFPPHPRHPTRARPPAARPPRPRRPRRPARRPGHPAPSAPPRALRRPVCARRRGATSLRSVDVLCEDVRVGAADPAADPAADHRSPCRPGPPGPAAPSPWAVRRRGWAARPAALLPRPPAADRPAG
jgi:hypothetical protein